MLRADRERGSQRMARRRRCGMVGWWPLYAHEPRLTHRPSRWPTPAIESRSSREPRSSSSRSPSSTTPSSTASLVRRSPTIWPSGLLPAVVAIALAAVYPRLRPGARAIVALTSGSLAIVAGVVDGLRHVLIDRVAGDDLTALLALAAGVVLTGLGMAVLWRSRRLDEPLPRRYGRRMLVAIAGVVAVYFAVLPVGLAIVVNHKARSPVERADLGAPYRPVTLGTRDGLTLAGWYAPSRNRAAVIVFPGRVGPVAHARVLTRHGYGVLMLDRRGEGESDGDYNARGWGGEPDLEAAISYLVRRPDVDAERIGGLGLSVGGELLLQTAARDRRLRAVVSEGAGTQSLNDQMQIPDVPKALRWLSPMTVETAAGVVLANRRPPPGLVRRHPRIAPRPVLLISAGRGNPDEDLNGVYRDAGGPYGHALGDPAGRAHRWPRRRARRLRAARDRIPRRGAPRALVALLETFDRKRHQAAIW